MPYSHSKLKHKNHVYKYALGVQRVKRIATTTENYDFVIFHFPRLFLCMWDRTDVKAQLTCTNSGNIPSGSLDRSNVGFGSKSCL